MKNTTTWTLCARAALARINGRTRIMAAPVVPTTLAMSVPKASTPALLHGLPPRWPVINSPPATV